MFMKRKLTLTQCI